MVFIIRYFWHGLCYLKKNDAQFKMFVNCVKFDKLKKNFEVISAFSLVGLTGVLQIKLNLSQRNCRKSKFDEILNCGVCQTYSVQYETF